MAQSSAAVSAIGISLVGTPLPEEIETTFTDHGMGWRLGNLASLGERSADESSIYLLWVDSDWKQGVDQLVQLPEARRQRTVLTGVRHPGSQVIRDVTRVGALAAVAWPIPEWFLMPLQAAAGRGWHSYLQKLTRAVAGLQEGLEHSPESLLVRAAHEAGRLLGADLALATLRLKDNFEVLVRTEHGEIRKEPWKADPERRRAPTGLTKFVLQHKEITIIPAASHSTLCEPGKGEDAYQSAVIQPLHIEPQGQDEPPIIACINLYWSEPYLPTPKEVFALGMIAAIAKSSLGRLLEHARFSKKLSVTPSRPEEASRNLHDLLEIVCDRTASDGAKVFVVLRSPEGPKIWQLGNTDFPDKELRSLRFRAEQGLADWVLFHDDWLLIPKASAADETAEGKKRCISGRYGETEVRARSETEYFPAHESPDREQSMLFVPLHARGKGTGVLAVWREHPEIYDKNTDPERLLYFAPHIASTCHRLLHLRKAQEELEAISTLTHQLDSSRTLFEAYEAVVAGVGRLADAACAVLLHLESEPSQGGPRVFMSALWTARSEDRDAVARRLERFHVRCAGEPDEWWLSVGAALEDRNLELVYRRFLMPAHDDPPPLGIALLDPKRSENEPTFFSDDLLDQYARSFLQAATAMLENHAANLASRLDDQIGDFSEEENLTGSQILARSAKLLKEATGADAALIYSGTPENMRVLSSWPPQPSLAGRAVKSKSLTQRSLSQREPIRVLDVELHQQDMDRENIEIFAETFNWPQVGSWLCCAVQYAGRSIGLIKILTRGGGAFLGADHEEIVRLVAARTAIEMHKANRQVSFEKLLRISNELVAFRGENLGREMIDRLESWVRETLPREHCQVVVSARIAGTRSLILSGSEGLKRPLLKKLDTLSLDHPNRQSSEPSKRLAVVNGAFVLSKPRGIAAPLGLLDEERLQGHLFLLDNEPFADDEVEAIRDAAHYMAIVLDGERERVVSRAAMGHFRHAAIGPIMGVGGASTEIAHLTTSKPIDYEKMKAARSRLREEIDSVRLWEDNTRFYLSESVELKLKQQSIKSIVSNVIERFEPRAQDRGITLRMVSNKRGGLQLLVDKEALDLAVTNLLDNALKYSFFNREITVGVDSHGFETVEIWVEDVGHKIKESARDQIYKMERRSIEFDPFRSIRGQGLGLYMVAVIVDAHGGRLDHNCQQHGTGDDPETTPYKVRFTIELPTRKQY